MIFQCCCTRCLLVRFAHSPSSSPHRFLLLSLLSIGIEAFRISGISIRRTNTHITRMHWHREHRIWCWRPHDRQFSAERCISFSLTHTLLTRVGSCSLSCIEVSDRRACNHFLFGVVVVEMKFGEMENQTLNSNTHTLYIVKWIHFNSLLIAQTHSERATKKCGRATLYTKEMKMRKKKMFHRYIHNNSFVATLKGQRENVIVWWAHNSLHIAINRLHIQPQTTTRSIQVFIFCVYERTHKHVFFFVLSFSFSHIVVIIVVVFVVAVVVYLLLVASAVHLLCVGCPKVDRTHNTTNAIFLTVDFSLSLSPGERDAREEHETKLFREERRDRERQKETAQLFRYGRPV